MLNLRPADESDVPAILRFINLLAEFEKLAHEAVATEERLREELFGAKPAAEVVIAEWDGAPVAFALYFHNFSTFLGRKGLYLEDLFVLPEYRGKGIGRALLSHLAGIALDRGCGRFEWSVLDWNEPAIQVYRRLGAVPLDDWTVQRVTGDALAKLAGR